MTILPKFLRAAVRRGAKSVADFQMIMFITGLFLASGLSVIQAQTFPPGFSQTLVASGITSPTVVKFAPDSRIFVAQQNGALRVIKNGSLLPTSFVSLTVDSQGERGLLGIAFDPNFTTNQYIYLYYTVPTSGTVSVHNRVSRFTANGDVVASGSELILLDLDNLTGATNHNGGSLAFGPDGKLYIAVGENATTSNSQTLNNRLGKVLRINADGSIPTDNPFYNTATGANRSIWALGLRNPYTIAFQPGTGRLFVNDVGQSSWEEINDATTGGQNFGWPTAEGVSSNTALTNPVYAYAHGSGDGVGCAITGGTFFNPPTTTYPTSFSGTYFFQDFCNSWINVLTFSGGTAVRSSFATGLAGLALGLTTGPDGNLYYLSLSNSELYRIMYNNIRQTVQNGDWNTAATWEGGQIPVASEIAVVRHTVHVATGATVQALRIQYQAGGRISLLSNGRLRLGL
jgi:glucose/arabinose dehydrogenase